MATLHTDHLAATAGEPARRVDDHLGNLFDWRLRAADTAGALAMADVLAQPGCEPPIHVHASEDEVFMVEEGAVTFVVGGREIRAGAGSVVFLPRGVPHGFRVDSTSARMRLLVTPAGFETFMHTWSTPATAGRLPSPPTGIDPVALTESLAGHGVTVVGPPPGVPGWGAAATA